MKSYTFFNIVFFYIDFPNFFSDKAWVTLATNDSYSLGALVLAHSLKAVKTVHKLAILITPGVTTPMKYYYSQNTKRY